MSNFVRTLLGGAVVFGRLFFYYSTGRLKMQAFWAKSGVFGGNMLEFTDGT